MENHLKKAFKLLSTIRENIKSGTGPKSLAETRIVNEAQAAAAEQEARAKVKAATTFSDFWKNEYWPVPSATKTARTVETESGYYAKWIKPALGDIALQQIDAAKVEALALRIQKAGKSAGTVARILGIVSLVWNRAADRGIVTGDCPCRRVKKPKQDNQRVRFLTEEEARILLDALALRSLDVHDEALRRIQCATRLCNCKAYWTSSRQKWRRFCGLQGNDFRLPAWPVFLRRTSWTCWTAYGLRSFPSSSMVLPCRTCWTDCAKSDFIDSVTKPKDVPND
jgi:integrase